MKAEPVKTTVPGTDGPGRRAPPWPSAPRSSPSSGSTMHPTNYQSIQ